MAVLDKLTLYLVYEYDRRNAGWASCDETQRPQPAGFMTSVIKLIKHDIWLFNAIYIMYDNQCTVTAYKCSINHFSSPISYMIAA